MGLLILGVGMLVWFVALPLLFAKLACDAIASLTRCRRYPLGVHHPALFLAFWVCITVGWWKHFQLPYAQTGAGEEAAIAAANQSPGQTRTEATGRSEAR